MAQKHKKSCSSSLVIGKMQIKMTWKCHLIPNNSASLLRDTHTERQACKKV